MTVDISLKALLEAGCHFGHQTVRWNPKMKPYIYMARDGVHIFDLAKTKEGLEEAIKFAGEVTSQGGKILFVGTKRQAKEIVFETAKKVGMPYVTQRWPGGGLTNFEQIKKSLDRLTSMKEKRAAGQYKDYTKKEQLLIDRKLARTEKFLGGLVGLEQLPEAVFIVDVKRELSVALEARQRGVKVIALVDTNANPDLVDYVIPVNDDASKSIELIVQAVGESIEEGKKKKVEGEKEVTKKVKEEKREENPKS